MHQVGVDLTVLAREIADVRSPVRTLSDLFYGHARFASGGSMALSPDLGERAVYVVEGSAVNEGAMAVLADGAPATIAATESARAMVLGGAPLDGPRHIWWNFVSSSKARIEQAKSDWIEGRFPAVPGDTDNIPLPNG